MSWLLWFVLFMPAPDGDRPIIRDNVQHHLVVNPSSGKPIIRQGCCG